MTALNYSQYASQSEFKLLISSCFLSNTPACQLYSYEWVMNGGIAPSIRSPWSNVSRVSNYAFKNPRLPGWSPCAKAWSTTIKFLNLRKIICIQVSKHASALKAQKMTTLSPTMVAQMGIKEKSKLFLGILYQYYIGIEERLRPGARHPAV